MSNHFRDTCMTRAIAVNLDVGLPRLQGFDQEVGEQARGRSALEPMLAEHLDRCV
jgi:hypothetical protein